MQLLQVYLGSIRDLRRESFSNKERVFEMIQFDWFRKVSILIFGWAWDRDTMYDFTFDFC